MGHRKLSARELAAERTLREIVRLANQLPYTLDGYAQDIGRLREEEGIPSRIRREKPKGYGATHQVRARSPWSQPKEAS